jgi:hypothetical protein
MGSGRPESPEVLERARASFAADHATHRGHPTRHR